MTAKMATVQGYSEIIFLRGGHLNCHSLRKAPCTCQSDFNDLNQNNCKGKMFWLTRSEAGLSGIKTIQIFRTWWIFQKQINHKILHNSFKELYWIVDKGYFEIHNVGRLQCFHLSVNLSGCNFRHYKGNLIAKKSVNVYNFKFFPKKGLLPPKVKFFSFFDWNFRFMVYLIFFGWPTRNIFTLFSCDVFWNRKMNINF